jgi:hypothetical protein
VDAICIEQPIFKERLGQIPMMQSTYAEAASINIWLGEDFDCSLAAGCKTITGWYARTERLH